MTVASTELHWETDYIREASSMDKFRSVTTSVGIRWFFIFSNRELIGDNNEIFSVPRVIHALTSKRVLTSELVHGVPLDQLTDKDESIKNWVSKTKSPHVDSLYSRL